MSKSPKPLPKTLPGVVLPQYVRCGKSNCRCTDGDLHGPYYYRFWREDGRLRKQYVRLDDVDAVRAACRRRQKQAAARRKQRARWMQTYRNFTDQLKHVEATIHE